MAATPQPTYTPAPQWSVGRIIALVFGVVFVLPALGLLLGGGVLLWADLGNRTDGYVFSETDDFATEGFALSSERIDLATGADWLPLSAALGTARAEVTSADGSEIFIGIAPVDEGAAYLDGVARSVVDDLGTTAADEEFVDGGRPTALLGTRTSGRRRPAGRARSGWTGSRQRVTGCSSR